MPISQIPIYFRSTEIPFSCGNRPFSTSIEFAFPNPTNVLFYFQNAICLELQILN